MLSRHLQLFRAEPRILAFGASAAFLSSPGQTFFIALFVAPIAASLSYSSAEMGGIYLAATLTSASLLPAVGHWIDRVDLRLYVTIVLAGLAAACLSASMAENGLMLFVSFLFLRMCGQGLMTHIQATSVARYFVNRRGLALSITAMGLPLAIAVTPNLAAFLIGEIGWRAAYVVVGVFLIAVALPWLLWLTRHQSRFTTPLARAAGTPAPRVLDGLKIVATTRYFWLALPILVYMPFTATALTFHIVPIGEAQGWPGGLIATGFTLMALGDLCGLIVSGFIVDRLTARRMVPLMNLPLFVGIAVMGSSSSTLALITFFVCLGLSSGLVQTTFGSVWAEVYGVARLGTVRSFAAMLMVAGTAAGPAALGLALDSGLSIATIATGFVALGLAAALLSAFGVSQKVVLPAEDIV
ncbi:MFS family permease [Rhodopseudomonas julia]|uniref:MFS family permease n=1 Tax=Rhodopseudomonas julia TaxID=200617 RepID=A0ABU0CA68_9BRAD|nr:MFS transporter [Rhodopseudomonas julia]MDQ0325972.1 MFS family permease [Rhodopseudomonas julia]